VLLAHRLIGAPQEEGHHEYFTEDVTGDTFTVRHLGDLPHALASPPGAYFASLRSRGT
jgi:hypothetical protein